MSLPEAVSSRTSSAPAELPQPALLVMSSCASAAEANRAVEYWVPSASACEVGGAMATCTPGAEPVAATSNVKPAVVGDGTLTAEASYTNGTVEPETGSPVPVTAV